MNRLASSLTLVLLALLCVLARALPVGKGGEGEKKTPPSEGTINTDNAEEYMRYLNEMAKTNPGRFLYGHCHVMVIPCLNLLLI